MVARIASGRQVIPRLTRGVRAAGELPAAENVPPPQFAPLDLPAEHLRIVREGMDAVSNDPRGTAYRARIKEAGFALAGTTGPPQVRDRKHVGAGQRVSARDTIGGRGIISK